MPRLVSIIIPCFNAAPWLAATLESALGQRWPRKEVILVNDGSTDESLTIARSFERQGVRVISQGRRGACAARNRALSAAAGDYIQFLDADDLLRPDKIEVQMRRLATEPAGAIAGSPWERFYYVPGDYAPISNSTQPWHDFNDPFEWLLLSAKNGAMSPSHAWLTPVEIVESAGPWNEDLRSNQDGEFFARVLLHSELIAFCPDSPVYYRSGSRGSVSAQRDSEALKSRYRALSLIQEYMLDHEDSQRVRSACVMWLRRFVHGVYPNLPDITAEAETRMAKFGYRMAPPRGSSKYNFFIRLVGWRLAKRIRRVYYRIRYGFAG